MVLSPRFIGRIPPNAFASPTACGALRYANRYANAPYAGWMKVQYFHGNLWAFFHGNLRTFQHRQLK
jgi:hypothetical protein